MSYSGRATHHGVKRSAVWMVVGQLTTNAVRFGANLLLTRIFLDDAAAFGLQALVAGAMQLLQLLSDLGIWLSVVRSERGAQPEFLRTAWTLQVLRALLLFGAAQLVAPWIAEFFAEPQLTHLLRLAAIGLLLDGGNSARIMLLRRAAKMRPLMAIDVAATLLGSSATVGFAWWLRDASAMVYGSLVSALVRGIASYLPAGPRDGFAWDRAALRELLHLGIWVFANTALMYLATQDRLVFGTLVSQDELGWYYVAWMVASVPSAVFSSMATSLLLPLVSAHVADPSHSPTQVLQARAVLLALGGWCLSGICAGGPLLANLLYPESYRAVGELLPLACLPLFLSGIVEQSRMAVLLALGHYSKTALGSMVKLAALLVLVPIAHRSYGFHGAIVAFALADVPRMLLVAWLSRKTHLAGFWQDWWFVLLFCLAAWLGNAARLVAAATSWPATLGVVAVFVAVTAFWALLTGRPVLRFLRQRN